MRCPNIFSLFTLALLAVGCTVESSGEMSVDESAICCGTNCCLIGGTCFQRGEVNPANACEQCSPPTQSSWSAVPGCGVDAGTPAPDAAAPVADAGNVPAADAGNEAPDAGAPSTEDDGGCHAVAPALAHPLHALLLVSFIGGFAFRRTRRTAR